MSGETSEPTGSGAWDAGLTHATVTGLLWTGGGRGLVAVLQVVVLALLARLLTPSEFGVVGAAVVVTTFSDIFSQLGLGPALVQRKSVDADHISTAFAFSLLFGVLVGATIWLLGPLAASFFDIDEVESVLRALAWLFPVYSIGAVADAVARRNLEFRWLAQIEVVSFGLGYGATGVITALLGWGYWSLVAAYLGQAILRTVALLFRYPPKPPFRPRLESLRDLIVFGGMFTVGRLGTYVAGQGDNLVVGRWLGPSSLGLYIQAYQLTSRPAQLLGDTLDLVLFPTLARVQDDRERLSGAYRRALAANAFLVLPVSAVLAVLGEQVVAVLFGPQWADAAVPFQVLAIGVFLRTGERISGSIAKATGAVMSRAFRTWAFATLVVAGAWVGQHWGILGTAIGVTVALFVNWLMMTQLALKTAAMPWSTFRSAQSAGLRLASVAAASAFVGSVAVERAGAGDFVTLVAGSVAALASFFGFGALFPGRLVGDEGAWLIGRLRGVAAGLRRGGAAPSTTRPDSGQ